MNRHKRLSFIDDFLYYFGSEQDIPLFGALHRLFFLLIVMCD
ncbi:hypothetical protein [Pontibacillus halophilus]|nr:hypothetical protein [Pontibacillus halophilus]